MAESTHWMTISESNYTWEREALEFIRARFPSHEPYRAWSNFEFIAEDGSINEVDLLVFGPEGFFLVEIKSRPGRLFGDAGTWRWETDGKFSTRDNPLILANAKAKKLRSLLQRQKVCKNKGPLPYLDALVFCSAEGLQFELRDTAAYHVCLRDRDKTADAPARPGILAAIQRRECPGLDKFPRGTFDRPMAKLVSQAMEQAGIRPSVKKRTVSDYELKQIIGNGPGYQDWLATHVRLADVTRRVRLYHVRTESSADDREKIERAALREFQILESLQHPGVLRTYGFTEHAMGPALIFEHEPGSMRLDHYLIERGERIGVQERLDLMRQIAEVVRFAHEKKVVHRALSPQSILVTAPDGPRPRIKLFNWQVGYRDASSTSGGSRLISATSHVDRLVEDASTAYMAPEALSEENVVGEHLDVFSLGTLAYHLFSGEPPAANGLELSNKIRETKGLQISSVLNGAGEHLQFVVQFATNPEVMNRLDSASDFLQELDQVEDELTAPEHEYVTDPGQAQKGDLLPGHFTVTRRLGQGACSIAFLVERAGAEYVLKAANDPEQNGRVRDEADVLKNMHRHSHIVEVCEEVEIGDRAGFLMRPVFVEKAERRLETLGQRLRKEGRLQLDHLQRFGKDLLEVVEYLQEQGVAHRDIKPDNIAVGMVGKGDALHAVLFDFSLSRTPAENIRAGTSGYLDPLLPLRKPPRWDLHAERYAAAVTLYEMATGTMPRWGDGATDPSHLDCEVTIDAELFDAGVRESLAEFFRKAFRRDPAKRFDNAEVMRSAWGRCFENIDQPGALSDHEDEATLRALLAGATHDTQIHELGLGTRATNALDRANLLTVEDLLTVPMRRVLRLRGVGNTTRREIAAAVRLLREQLGTPSSPGAGSDNGTEEAAKKADTLDPGSLSVDLLAQRLLPRASKVNSDRSIPMIRALLGLEGDFRESWPSQADVAEFAEVTRARVNQVVGKFQARWAKEPAVTRLRDDLAGIVESAGGAMLVPELAESLIAARGSAQEEPNRTRLARAVVRAAVEVERSMGDPRFQVRRDGERVLVALSQDLAGYAFRLGDLADQIAGEDPLVPPLRVLQRLRELPAPASMVPLTDTRLVRLAASASTGARLSSRQELYPRGMEAGRVLKLSQGALYGVASLTLQEIQDRVRSRYPESAPLPSRPALDSLLDEAGFEFRWEPTLKGVGGYVSKLRDAVSVTSETRSTLRQSAGLPAPGAVEFTPELADERQFEERLQRGAKDGSFYALLVSPRHYECAFAALASHFTLKVVDFEGLFLAALRQVAEKARVNWDIILKTDARPHDGDWNKLLLLVNRAMPLVEEQIAATEEPILLIFANLMARYERMDVLERLRDKVGRRGGIPSLWLLMPGDQQAFMDGKTVPVLSPSQRVRVPVSWLKKQNRTSVP